jgi:hypothetical protein
MRVICIVKAKVPEDIPADAPAPEVGSIYNVIDEVEIRCICGCPGRVFYTLEELDPDGLYDAELFAPLSGSDDVVEEEVEPRRCLVVDGMLLEG